MGNGRGDRGRVQPPLRAVRPRAPAFLIVAHENKSVTHATVCRCECNNIAVRDSDNYGYSRIRMFT
jgi:hypothetical protein